MYESPLVYSPHELSIVNKIGQIVMPRLDFDIPDTIRIAEKLVKEYMVCGFIIFNAEIEQLRETTDHLQSISEIPLFFGVDAERGLGQLVKGATYFPFLMSQGAANDEVLLRKQAEITAEEMKYAGVNLFFGPVLDVNLNSGNPIINIRAFGDDPQLISRMGGIFISEVQKNGVLCCCKHFPGHGDTDADSHNALPVVEKSAKRLENEDLVPFHSAIKSNVASIMPAHIIYPGLDNSNKPATISKEILENLLRNKLGFNGLIISDSFKMEALDELSGESENALNAIASGVNIILDPEDPEILINSLSEMQSKSEPFADESLKRIYFQKRFMNHMKGNVRVPDFDKNAECSRELSIKSVCRLKGDNLKSSNVMIIEFDSKGRSESIFTPFKIKLEKRIKGYVNIVAYPEKQMPDNDTALIFLISTTVSAWTKYFELPCQIVDFIKSFESCSNEKILCNFGSPYTVSQFNFFDTVICSFDSNENCLQSVAEVLTGLREAEGKLPVAL